MASSLQKATAAANSYHSSAIRYCNEAKLIVEALDAHECDDRVSEVRKAHQKVQAAETAAMCLRSIRVAEAKLRAEAEVHLMSQEDLIMFRCHTCVVEEGILVERRCWR